MASTASAYGLKPVRMQSGAPYSGAMEQFPIASGTNTNLFTGQVVSISSDGVLVLVTTNGDNSTPFPAGTIGVFMGCEFTNPVSKSKQWSTYWPSGTAASDAVGYVVTDPNVVFQVQANGSLGQTALGQNAIFSAVQSTSTGSTVTGISSTAISTSTATTSGYAFRIVGFANNAGVSSVGDAYTDVLVKFNPLAHSYTNPTGI